jgi:hypothetical protein
MRALKISTHPAMGWREKVRGKDGITIRKESDLSWHLHEI